MSSKKSQKSKKSKKSKITPYSLPLGTKLKFLWRNIKKHRKTILLYGGITFIIFFALFSFWILKDLPNPQKLEKRISTESTKIYDRNGVLLYEIYKDKKRTIIPASEIPEFMKKAIVAAEDKEFYRHPGINIKGILRALIYNLLHRDTIQGGSSLTQQFIKNALLTPERTLSRKIKEAILSLIIERIYTKEEILTMYLNEAPFGSSAYGIEAAAQIFFGKHAKDLNELECIALATLPKAPTYYSPYGPHKEEFYQRMDYVINQMLEMGYITPEKAEELKKNKKTLVFQKLQENIKAPHFVMYIRELLVDKYGEKMVAEGGLRVYTSLDYEKQKIAEEAVRWGVDRLKRQKVSNGSLVAIDPKTGEILAMVGSKDFFDESIDGYVNVALRPRQPGSSFKPYAYATAFMKGYSPATMLIDVRTDFGNGWKPKNYDNAEHGIVNARIALAKSYNIPAVKILYMAGVQDTINLATKMGITTLTDPARYGLSIVLGGAEVKLLEHTSAYGIFATGGIKYGIHPILKIKDGKGNILEEYKPEKNKGERVIPASIAYQITSILSDTRYKFTPNLANGRPSASKTGTTDDYRDAWLIGYTPSLVAGVWVGNNDNSPMARVAGSVGAGPIWKKFMDEALKGTPIEKFEEPEGIKKIEVCSVSGLLPGPNCNEGKKVEIFAEGYNVPTKTCDVHLGNLKVCKVSEKIATDNCPDEAVEEKDFLQIKAEIPPTDPAYSRWQQPIAALANRLGYNKYPPQEECDLHTGVGKIQIDEFTVDPTIVYAGENINIIVKASAPYGVKHIQIYLGNELIETKEEANFEFTYTIPPTTLPGFYKIKIKATDNLLYSDERYIEIEVQPQEEPT